MSLEDVDIKNFIYETLDNDEELNVWDVSAYNFLHSITAQRICEKISGKDDYKYLIVCTQCGREVRKNRKSSIVDYPQLWRCGICGGTFKRVV